MDTLRAGVNITSREKQILRLIAMEFSTAEISAMLSISARTVETHRKNINRKTKAKTLAGLTKYAIKLGLIDEFCYQPDKRKRKMKITGCSICSQTE